MSHNYKNVLCEGIYVTRIVVNIAYGHLGYMFSTYGQCELVSTSLIDNKY